MSELTSTHIPVRSLLCPYATLAVCFVFVTLTLGSTAFAALVVGFLFYAMFSVKASLQVMALIAIIKISNSALISLPEEASGLTWVVLLLCSFRILLTTTTRDIYDLTPILVYTLGIAIITVLTSVAVDISLIKLFMFSVVSCSCLVGFSCMNLSESQRLLRWFCGVYFASIALSIPTFFFPDVGFATDGQGFQGIFNHPQAFGAFLAPAAAFMSTRLLTRASDVKSLAAIVSLVIWVLMFMSLSRNAALAAILSILLVTLLSALRRAQSGMRIWPLVYVAMVSVVVGVASFTIPDAAAIIKEFIYKGDTTAPVEQRFYQSRGFLIESEWHSFLEKPWTGYGFGVYPSGVFPDGVTYVWGVPVSAPTEKGFPTGILEETGVIGAILATYLLWSLVVGAARTKDYVSMAVLFSCLLLNLGEAIFFSVGGVGLFVWLLIGMSLSRRAPST